jgi:hypothetical protein
LIQRAEPHLGEDLLHLLRVAVVGQAADIHRRVGLDVAVQVAFEKANFETDFSLYRLEG